MTTTRRIAPPTLDIENQLFARGHVTVAGIDEVGRGAIAGPVCVGVVVVTATCGDIPNGLTDSKLLSAKRREELRQPLTEWAHAASLGWTSAGEIDAHGIVPALRLAAERALSSLSVSPTAVVLDGSHDWLRRAKRVNSADALAFTGDVVVLPKADQRCASVSAASVLAKVRRDALMAELSAVHPEYGWSGNKGYGSASHREAIASLGPTEHHRVSWNLV
jgi:ribonuclease HII